MKIVKKDNVYLKDIDVLVRVYENQSGHCDEKDQICSEILFKEHTNQDHMRFTSWLPRGAVNAIVSSLNQFAEEKWDVQVSNELANQVGVLTSCRENFEKSMEWDGLDKRIKVEKTK
jgi:hypothetical protein